jgi:hypothetical protein
MAAAGGGDAVTIGLQLTIAAVVLLVVADIAIYLRYGREQTISRGMYNLGKRSPVLALAIWVIGCTLIGLHFWW